MTELLILVDKKDQAIGLAAKEKCHQNSGILHRAFSIFIFDKKGQLLLQKRSSNKVLWPLFWSNSCCSHPKKGEDLLSAAQNRLKQEMGIDCQLRQEGKLTYQACFKDKGAEREITNIFIGTYSGPVFPNPEEVAEIKWVEPKKLAADIKVNPGIYTPWFKLIYQQFFSK